LFYELIEKNQEKLLLHRVSYQFLWFVDGTVDRNPIHIK